jgi:2-oxoisovalerate dehydrogenase E1 component
MLEPKALFASKGGAAGEDTMCRSAWRASRARERDMTIVAAGQMVPRSLEAAEILANEGIEAR